jgi:23S rRNA pseudouridine2457 synthase
MPRTILFWKPYGVVCQFSPSGEKKTLADFRLPKGVYAAGRLDHDSEGLLLLTDDGALQHRLTDPKFKCEKTYWVQVERVPAPSAIGRLGAGVPIKGGRTRPCRVRALHAEPELPPRVPPIRYRKTVPTAWLEIRLREGRNRQIRRMTAHISHPTLRLVRARIGDLTLKGLEPGRWRDIKLGELRRLAPAQRKPRVRRAGKL